MNDTITERELHSLNLQLFGSYIFLANIIVSIILLENSKRVIQNKTPFFEIDDKLNVVLINRIVSLGTALLFLYVNYKNIEIAKLKEQELDSYSLELLASILTSVSSILVLIVAIRAFDNNSFSLANLENPGL